MKVVFISNYLNHHQIPLSNALYQQVHGRYRFIGTQPMTQERMNLGWKVERTYPYEIHSYGTEEATAECKRLADHSDVVIVGSAVDDFMVDRLKAGKLTFKYSERFYKEGTPLKKFPRHLVSAWLHHGRFQKYPLYMLCASAYTAGDAARFGNYIGRCYKWGYFPETKHYDLESLLKNKKRTSLLWAGRLIDWKHPEYAIRAARRLKEEGYNFELNMVGTGAMEEELRAMVCQHDLGDVVHLLGSMPPEQVRTHMERAGIFLFTSDRQEGWGAVLNESMNSGCAVVACSAIGSVPFLVKDGINGETYPEGDFEAFYRKVKKLMDDVSLQERYGREAYRTITEEWCAEVATERFLKLAECLQNGKDTPFEEGACSKAEILKGV